MTSSNLIRDLSEKADKLRKEVRDIDSATAEGQEKIRQISDELAKIGDQVLAESRKLAALSADKQDDQQSEQDERAFKKFDFAKVLRCLVRGDYAAGTGRLDGLEAELAQAGESERRSAGLPLGGGIMLPRMLVRRSRRSPYAEARAMIVGDPAKGGYAVEREAQRGLLDDLFASSVLHQAGATVLEDLVGDLPVTRILSDDNDPQWTAEMANAVEQNPTLAMLLLTPKRQSAFIDISEKLLLQRGEVVEAALRHNLTGKLGVVRERSFYHGTGGVGPTGILASTGIGSVEGGAAGAKISLKTLVDLETAVDEGDALGGSLRYVTNGAVRGALKQTPVVGGTDSRRLLEGNAGDLNGYSPLFTNTISRKLTKGTAKDKCSAIIFGNFADYYAGYWGGLALEMERGRENAIAGKYTLVASLYCDGGVVRPKSFAACTDVLTA